jgi:hypothetical protein
LSIKSVQIVLHPDQEGWILHKIGQRIKAELELMEVETKIVSDPVGNADVFFWLYYGHSGIVEHAKKNPQIGIRSAFVTHVDDAAKTRKVAKLVNSNVDLVFMSEDHANTVSADLGHEKFFNILLGSDLASYDAPYRVGIFSKRFPDGRKNEKWLVRLAKEIDLGDVQIIFVGSGWKVIASKLQSLGVSTIRYDDDENKYPEYHEFPDIYRSLDLFLSPGFDEGSMGSLDAFIIGKDMLISRHGFHYELELEEENYLDSYEDLKGKFIVRLDEFRKRRRRARDWSWRNAAIALLDHWNGIIEEPMTHTLVSENVFARNQEFTRKIQSVSRALNRAVKIGMLERVKNRIKRKRPNQT